MTNELCGEVVVVMPWGVFECTKPAGHDGACNNIDFWVEFWEDF